ncbi:platelet endothelial cell adhesion molecule isoform X2 [Pseudophryne corroboree]|uniref:platelet endothelial cell adhesion molecule isoform X2 n=1 Tax=Pseudophryne corroboree TaxID=495146 RepID=UPI0030818A2B
MDFTINNIVLSAIPSTKLTNGEKLQLKCLVSFGWTTHFVLNSTISFHKGDRVIHHVTTQKEQEIYTIQKSRVSHTGHYYCKVSAEGKDKKSDELIVKVTKLSAPSITVSKNETSEGEEVAVTCEALEEEPPMLFSFYKTNQDEKKKKDQKTKVSSDKKFANVTFEIKAGENILNFECGVNLVGIDEESPRSKQQTVTVLAPFTTPKIEVFPSNNFTEGKDMLVECSIQRRPGEVTLTLQKGNHIVHISKTDKLSYNQFATVNDMGNYTCKAEGRRVSKSSTVLIIITELFPRPSLILNTYSKNMYIEERDQLSLECSVSDLSPEVSNKEESYFIVHKGVKTYVKKGEKLQLTAEEKNSGSYFCELTISNITKTSDPVLIQVYAPVTKPNLKHIIKGNSMVVPGDTLELACQSQYGTPPIKYSLYLGNKLLETKMVDNNMEAKFLVNVTKPNDSGQYRCHAANRNEKSKEYSNTVNITVIIPVEDVSLTIIPTNGEVEEGAELSLVCIVNNGTLPINFRFYVRKEIDILLHNVTIANQMHTSFQVQSFSHKEEGAYFCIASNRANKGIKSRSMEAKAVLASWKKGIISAVTVLIIVAAVAIVLYLYLDKVKKDKDMSIDNRTAKAINSSNEKSAVEMKTGNLYVGSIQNEDELHILKTAEENLGNNEQNHGEEYTEVDDPTPHPHEDAVETNINATSSTIRETCPLNAGRKSLPFPYLVTHFKFIESSLQSYSLYFFTAILLEYVYFTLGIKLGMCLFAFGSIDILLYCLGIPAGLVREKYFSRRDWNKVG